jgi:hypothetical protein
MGDSCIVVPSGSSRTQQVLLVLLVATGSLSLWGIAQTLVFCFNDGWYGNFFSAMWVNWFALIMAIQAYLVMMKPSLTTLKTARFYSWVWYSIWMLACALVLLICYGVGLSTQFAWVFLWLPGPAVIIYSTVSHHKQQLEMPKYSGVGSQQKPACCSGAAWRKGCKGFGSCMGWSSIFWLSVMGFFLVLQGAWLVSFSILT